MWAYWGASVWRTHVCHRYPAVNGGEKRQGWKVRACVWCVCACVWAGVSDSTKVIPKAPPGGTPQIKSRKLSLNLTPYPHTPARRPHLTNTTHQIKGEALCHGRGIKHMGGGVLERRGKKKEGAVHRVKICKSTLRPCSIPNPRSIVAQQIWRSLELKKQMAATSPSSWTHSREASAMLTATVQFEQI